MSSAPDESAQPLTLEFFETYKPEITNTPLDPSKKTHRQTFLQRNLSRIRKWTFKKVFFGIIVLSIFAVFLCILIFVCVNFFGGILPTSNGNFRLVFDKFGTKLILSSKNRLPVGMELDNGYSRYELMVKLDQFIIANTTDENRVELVNLNPDGRVLMYKDLSVVGSQVTIQGSNSFNIINAGPVTFMWGDQTIMIFSQPNESLAAQANQINEIQIEATTRVNGLSVSEFLNVNGDLFSNSGDVTVHGNVNISGNASFVSLSVSGVVYYGVGFVTPSINVSHSCRFHDLIVKGTFVSQSLQALDLTIFESTSTGSLRVLNELNVSGLSQFYDLTTQGYVFVDRLYANTFNVSGLSTFSNVTVNGTFEIIGSLDTTSLTVSGSAILCDTLISGPTKATFLVAHNLTSGLNARSTTTLGPLITHSDFTAEGIVFADTSGIISSNLTVTPGNFISSGLIHAENAVFGSGTISGKLESIGPCNFEGGVYSQNITVEGPFSVDGNFTSSQWTVMDNVFSKQITILDKGPLSFIVNGDAVFNGVVTVDSTVRTTSLNTVNFTVHGETTIRGGVHVLSNIFALGGLNSKSNMNVSNLVVKNRMTVEGPANFRSSLFVFANATFRSLIDVKQFNITENLEVANQPIFAGGLIVDKSTVFNGDLLISGFTQMNGGLNVNQLVTQEITISGNTTFTRSLFLSGTLVTRDRLQASSLLANLGNITVGSNVSTSSLCLQFQCRSRWPTASEILKSTPRPIVASPEFTLGPGNEEIFFIGKFLGFKEFLIEVESLKGNGIFKTSVLRGVSDGLSSQSFRGQVVEEGTYWGSVVRRDRIPGSVKVRATVTEVF